MLRVCFFIFSLIYSVLLNAEGLAKKYIEKYGLEYSVGQLFVVGLPTDYKNTTGSSDYKQLVEKMNVSGIIINSYNVPVSSLSKEKLNSAVSDVTGLINKLKFESNLNESPLLIFADFESYRYSSIHYPLNPPPNPMALASTGDTKYSYYSGKIAAAQLKSIGVDVILGPVFDLDKSMQGRVNNMTSMRSFSSSIHIARPHLNAYLNGLKDGGVSSFSKHFPSYGSTYENAHTEPLSFIGSEEQILEDLNSYRELKDLYDGVVTSHLILKPSRNNIPASFDSVFFDKYMGDFNDKIVITDDLSDMESSADYIKRKYKRFSLSKAAVEAFKAGNDLLLFSHINTKQGSKHSKRSEFYVEDVKDAISEITKTINSSSKYRMVFEKKLDKILSFKAKHAMTKASGDFYGNVLDAIDGLDNIDNVEEFNKEVYEKAIVEISYGGVRDLKSYVNKNKILYILPDRISITDDVYDGYNVDFMHVSRTFSSKKYELFKSTILSKTKEYDYVLFVVESQDHINSVDNVRLKNVELLDKMIVFLHASPNSIPVALIDEVTIYGNYSLDPISYLIDFNIVKSDVDRKSRIYSSLSIVNGSIHKAEDAPAPIKGDYVSKALDDFNTVRERELSHEKDDLEKEIFDLKKGAGQYIRVEYGYKYIYIIFMVFSVLLYFYYHYNASHQTNGWLHYKNKKTVFISIKVFKVAFLFWILSAFYPNNEFVGFINSLFENFSIFDAFKKLINYLF